MFYQLVRLVFKNNFSFRKCPPLNISNCLHFETVKPIVPNNKLDRDFAPQKPMWKFFFKFIPTHKYTNDHFIFPLFLRNRISLASLRNPLTLLSLEARCPPPPPYVDSAKLRVGSNVPVFAWRQCYCCDTAERAVSVIEVYQQLVL